jgi:adenosylmethionine-8-amino-7-oxononanoate aminotransferase
MVDMAQAEAAVVIEMTVVVEEAEAVAAVAMEPIQQAGKNTATTFQKNS